MCPKWAQSVSLTHPEVVPECQQEEKDQHKREQQLEDAEEVNDVRDDPA
jgi:hypothetical protein